MHPFCCVSDEPSPIPRQTPAPLGPSDPPPMAADPSPNLNGAANGAHDRLSSQDDVMMTDIIGGGISGVLYKWVNYGKGWRPRWFSLQDGVLSYFKIHGPDRIDVNLQSERFSRVIGEDSLRRLARSADHHRSSSSSSCGGAPVVRGRPIGEVHLKVSSVRMSRSDDKRFSIFTGTKRLHMRAETREDRALWVEVLQAVKEMFPRVPNRELMVQADSVTPLTEKLRQRLQEEGVNEGIIRESEQIMRTEVANLQNQLVVLKQRQLFLMDTLRQLEVQKRARSSSS